MKKVCMGVGFILILGLIWLTGETVQAEQTNPPFFSTATTFKETHIYAKSVEFPVVLGNAGLIVTDIVSFEGILPGEQEEIYTVDAVALLVYNPTNTGIVSAAITLTRGAETLHFDLEYLPGGSKALVLERNANPIGNGVFDSCECSSFVVGSFTAEIPGIQIAEEGGNLILQNLSDTPLPAITVYYKQYTPEDDFYVGKAMSVRFAPMLPGETQAQPAYGYAEGYSRVAAIIAK